MDRKAKRKNESIKLLEENEGDYLDDLLRQGHRKHELEKKTNSQIRFYQYQKRLIKIYHMVDARLCMCQSP